MIPILFDDKATTFTTNGIGRLTDCISCTVTEERNGIYELEAEYPVNGQYYSEIKHSRIIAVLTGDGKQQPFRIYKVTKPLNGKITIQAQHISYQLSDIPCMPFIAANINAALEGLKSGAVRDCPFTFETDITSEASYSQALPATIKSRLGGVTGSILDVYGGEYEWDLWTVRLHKARGTDNGVKLLYGKNITDIKQEESIEETYTGIFPYWSSGESNLVTLPEKTINTTSEKNFPYPKIKMVDFSGDFDGQPSVEELRLAANQYITNNSVGIPSVSIDISFVALWQTEEYKDIAPLEKVRLCDTVTVIFDKLGIETKAKVIETEFDVLTERYNKISIGEVKSTLSSTILDTIEQTTISPTEVQSRIDHATGMLNKGLGGHLVINRNESGWANEIIFMDSENTATAKNCLRINLNGLGFSNNGYNGPFQNAWTIDGQLSADFIKTGSLIVGGATWNTNGEIKILDKDDKVLALFNKDGVNVYSGKIQGTEITASSFGSKEGKVYFSDEGDGEFMCNDWSIDSSDCLNSPTVDCYWDSDGSIQCRDIYFPLSSWAKGWSLIEMLKDLYDRTSSSDSDSE